MQDLTKRVFTVYVGRKMHMRIKTTLANATDIWDTICKANSGTTVSLYNGHKRGLENLCSTGK